MSISNIRAKTTKILKVVDNSNDNQQKKSEILSNFKNTPTIISQEFKLIGEIFSGGIVEIQGSIDGTINGNSIILREDGVINGTVIAENFSIRGKFDGKIRAKNVSIYSKALVRGDIEYSSLSVEDGANIDGNFKKI